MTRMLVMIVLLITTASLVSGLRLNTPGTIDSFGDINVTWVFDRMIDPPTFQLLLVCICATSFTPLSNIQSSMEGFGIQIPAVKDGDYWLRAISDDGDTVLSESHTFILTTANGERLLSPLPSGSATLPIGFSTSPPVTFTMTTTATVSVTVTSKITLSPTTIIVTSSSVSTNTTAASTSTHTSSLIASHSSSQVGIIVGANIGVLIGLFLAIFLLSRLRKRLRESSYNKNKHLTSELTTQNAPRGPNPQLSFHGSSIPLALTFPNIPENESQIDSNTENTHTITSHPYSIQTRSLRGLNAETQMITPQLQGHSVVSLVVPSRNPEHGYQRLSHMQLQPKETLSNMEPSGVAGAMDDGQEQATGRVPQLIRHADIADQGMIEVTQEVPPAYGAR